MIVRSFEMHKALLTTLKCKTDVLRVPLLLVVCVCLPGKECALLEKRSYLGNQGGVNNTNNKDQLLKLKFSTIKCHKKPMRGSQLLSYF